MPDEVPEGQSTSGGSLRDQYEASLARENATREALERSLGVNPGDLKGVDPEGYADRATEIKAEREAADRAAAARVLGIPEDQLDAYRSSMDNHTSVDTPQARAAGLSGLNAPPARFEPSVNFEEMDGEAHMEAALRQQEAARRRS